MADAFGIVGVIGVIGQITKALLKLGLDWNDVPADSKRFLDELQALKTVLAETHANILTSNDFKEAFDGQQSALLTQLGGNMTQQTSISSMISACKKELEKLLDRLNKHLGGSQFGWQRLKGALLAGKTRETVQTLHRECQAPNSLIAIGSLSLNVRVHKEVTQARKEQRAWWTNQESMAILDWLTPVNYGSQQSDFIRRRQEGPGTWLLDSSEFRLWVEEKDKTLFCPGIPGAGKTILTSIVVDHLRTWSAGTESAGIAYLYCNFRRHADQRVEDLLASLLKQLSHSQPALPGCIRSLYDQHKRDQRRPSLVEILAALETVATSFSRLFLIVDALDECQISDGSRTQFINALFDLQSNTSANVFATSRFTPNITQRFSSSVSLEIRAHAEDVRNYITGNISRLPACVCKSLSLQAKIAEEIVQAVDGMFLLAQLHLDSLVGKKSPKAIEKALETFRKGTDAYDRAYDDAMARIEGQLDDETALAKQTLSWITCAKVPLSTTELQYAIAVEVDEAELDQDNMSEMEDILAVCAGLVTVDEDSGIVRLVHYTTQEYFLRTWKHWFPHAQVDIMDTCSTFLSFDAFRSGPCHTEEELRDRLASYPLYRYAARYWGDHAREAKTASRVLLDLLGSGAQFEALFQAYSVHRHRVSVELTVNAHRRLHRLHAAVYFGIYDAVKHLIQTDSPNLRDGDGRTPLSLAAYYGHADILKLLLQANVNVDSRDRNGRTPLLWVVFSNQRKAVELLLQTGRADADSRDDIGFTPLHLAVAMANETTVKLLLDTGRVDVNWIGSTYDCTPLIRAVQRGDEGTIRLLLTNDRIDVNLGDRCKDRTPLAWAAWYGNEAAVRLLLSTRAVNADAEDPNGKTPLAIAADRGHAAVAKLLLDTRAVNADAKSRHGQTPLFLAAARGYEAVVKLLLDTRAVDVDAADDQGETPLFIAARRGHKAVVKLLLDTPNR